MRALAAVLLVACSARAPLPEPDFVEVASTRVHDAGVDADEGEAAPYDATLPWPCCDPPVGNGGPHHAR